MKKILTISFLIFWSFGCSQTFQVKRALDNIAQGDLEKARNLIVKAYEKDSLDPGVNYALSKLYENPEYNYTNIDTAYQFIIQAKEKIDSLGAKDLQKLVRNGIDKKAIEKHEHLLDSQAYVEAVKQNTVKSYNYFITTHPNAAQVPKAINMRYDVAWKNALEENTHEGYLSFFNEYPEAPQKEEAKRRYERLYFKSLTSDGRLESYKEYLSINTDTPFRDVAEREILEISTVSNDPGAFVNFIDNYPDSKLRNEALEVFYHLEKDHGMAYFKSVWWTDSLRRIHKTGDIWKIPVFDDQAYNFLSDDGKIIFEKPFSMISDNHICEGSISDFVFIPGSSSSRLINLQGDTFFEDSFTSATDLGFGIIRTGNFGKFGAVHKRGKKILPAIHSDISIIDGSFIAYKQNNSWGLISFFGREILEPLYDNFEVVNKSIIITLNGRHAITSKREISKAANDIKPDFVFIYDEYEAWSNSKIWVRSGQKEGLINDNSSFDIPLGNYQIIELKNGYITKGIGESKFYNLQFQKIEGSYSSISTNDRFHLFKNKSESFLLPLQSGQLQKYDSIRLIGNSFAVSVLKYNDVLIFSNSHSIELKYNDKYRLLQSGKTEYILVNSPNKLSLYNTQGEMVLEGKFNDISLLSEEYIATEHRGKKTLYDYTGTKLLNTTFNTIAPDNEGGVTLLDNGKIGYYHLIDSVYFQPQFSKKVIKLKQNRYKVHNGKKFGVLDAAGEPVVDYMFDDIELWSDSTYVVSLGLLQSIIRPVAGDTILADLSAIRPIPENDKNKVYVVIRDGNSGLISNTDGILIPLAYTFIRKAGKLFIAEKYFREADFYIIVYYNKRGDILRRQGLNAAEYEAIYCDN